MEAYENPTRTTDVGLNRGALLDATESCAQILVTGLAVACIS